MLVAMSVQDGWGTYAVQHLELFGGFDEPAGNLLLLQQGKGKAVSWHGIAFNSGNKSKI